MIILDSFFDDKSLPGSLSPVKMCILCVSHPEVLGGLLLGPSLPVLLLFVVIDEVLPDQLPANKETFLSGGCGSQSRQSARLFSSRLNWDSPIPSPAGECAPPPLWFRGSTHACVPFLTWGHTSALDIYVLCDVDDQPVIKKKA
jgi:hypothetical protein